MALFRVENNLKMLIIRFGLVIVSTYFIFSFYWSTIEIRRVKTTTMDCAMRNILLGPAMQDDPCVVNMLRENYLIPPSTLPYNIQPNSSKMVLRVDHSDVDSARKEIIEKYIDTQNPNGFFIECGANDGEFLSNTLQIEMDYKWNGLLVEANNEAFAKLKTKNRKAWLLNACLSPVPYTSQFTFFTDPHVSGNSGLNYRKDYGATEKTTVQCFPLYAVLVSLNITSVDYFSLDIEGKELDVLKTIPFDKITFKVLTIEHWFIPGGSTALQVFMKSKGYEYIRELRDGLTRDSVYIHHSLVNEHYSRIR